MGLQAQKDAPALPDPLFCCQSSTLQGWVVGCFNHMKVYVPDRGGKSSVRCNCFLMKPLQEFWVLKNLAGSPA